MSGLETLDTPDPRGSRPSHAYTRSFLRCAREAADREHPQTEIAHRLGRLERDLGDDKSSGVRGLGAPGRE